MKSGKEIAEELGLKIQGGSLSLLYYNAGDIHRVLESGIEVLGEIPGKRYDGYVFGSKNIRCEDTETHKALLLNIQPIKPKRMEFEMSYGDSVRIPDDFYGKRVKVTVEEVK